MTDHATPNLPSRDFETTSRFYAALGFAQGHSEARRFVTASLIDGAWIPDMADDPHPGFTATPVCDWPDWPTHALVIDVRALAKQELDAHRSCALATLVSSSGPSPRPLGAQMLVRSDGSIEGCVSGGCVEAAVAADAGLVLSTGSPRVLSFGHGSPFIDVPLSCGSRIEIAVERLAPDDPVAQEFAASAALRREVEWRSGLHGTARVLRALDNDRFDARGQPRAGTDGQSWWVRQAPRTRLLIVGGDAVALALATMAAVAGIEVVLNRANGPSTPPPAAHVAYWRKAPDAALAALNPDAWTAVVCTTHDLEMDELALAPALRSSAFYVGALGSRRKLGERQQRLRALAVRDADIERLRAPVGLDIGAATPAEIAVSVLAELIQALRRR